MSRFDHELRTIDEAEGSYCPSANPHHPEAPNHEDFLSMGSFFPGVRPRVERAAPPESSKSLGEYLLLDPMFFGVLARSIRIQSTEGFKVRSK